MLLEVEHTFKRKRSLEQLLKYTKKYEKQLAIISGYSIDVVEDEAFFCIGYNELWNLYSFHKQRILKNENSQTQNTRIKPDKFNTLFAGIEDLTSLEQKYLSLRSKNLDNPIELDVIEKYYYEAKEKIKNNSANNTSQSNTKTSNDPESTKEKNNKLFKNIWDLEELKKKYHRLAKLNHPDFGGSNAAMKKLIELYHTAQERILNNSH